jgi:hypothetical protein
VGFRAFHPLCARKLKPKNKYGNREEKTSEKKAKAPSGKEKKHEAPFVA